MQRMREVCLIVTRADAVVYADASASPAALPDSRARWQAIWDHRAELGVVAHSHPLGPSAFSAEDESTMAAIDSALGTDVRYVVVAPRTSIVRVGARGATAELIPEPWWVDLLRLASGMTRE
jgi:hypothetical protein